MRVSPLLLFVALAACSRQKPLEVDCEKGDPAACDALAAQYTARATELCARDAGASPACARVAAVPLDLPKAGAEVKAVLNVTLLADGRTLIDDQPVPTDDAVVAAAAAAQKKNPDVRAVIKADSAATHGRVIHVLDLLKRAQVSKIAFGVQPIDVPPPARLGGKPSVIENSR